MNPTLLDPLVGAISVLGDLLHLMGAAELVSYFHLIKETELASETLF
jgi:hypothetical protein